MYFALPYFLLVRAHRAALDARRKDRTWRFFAYSVAAGLCAAVLVTIALMTSYVLVIAGMWWLAIAMLALFVEPILHGALVRHVFAPLGWYRAAFWTAHLATMRDSDAFGLVCAAWAHSGKPTPAGEAWIAERRDRRRPLGDAEIVTTALLVAARGDADSARELMRSIDRIVEDHGEVRELANEWLACDAAERGAWSALAADANAARRPASALVYLLEGIALRRVGDPRAPGGAELRARWLLAPHRRATRALLDDVAPAPAPTTAEEPAPTGAPLPDAIAAHVELAHARPSAGTLGHAIAAWDRALADDATRTWIARRALELEAPAGAVDRALRDVSAAVTDELGRLADAAAIAAPPSHGPVGAALARRLRHGRLDALEAGFTRWADRRKIGSVLPAIDEWREWVALRAAYDTAAEAGGLDLRRLAFPHVYSTGTSMAAWLWNSRKEYALSHAISAWLLAEAMAVGDTEAIELCTRNVALAVPTRFGNIRT